MDIMKIVMTGIIAALLAVVLREEKPETAFAVSLVTGLVIFVFVITKLNSVMTVLNISRLKRILIYYILNNS